MSHEFVLADLRPDNWYKRPIGDDYSIPKFLIDVLEHAAQYPRLLDIGGNTDGVNSFTAVDLANLTGGVFNAANLLEPDNLLCVVLQITQAAAPDALGSLYTDVSKALTPLADIIRQVLAGKMCPQLQSIDESLFEQYPGYTMQSGSYAGLAGAVKDPVGAVTEGVGGVIGGLLPGN